MKQIRFFVVLLPATIVYCLMANKVLAQNQNTITVSPQLIQLDLRRDLPEAEFSYTNNTSQTIEISLSMQDVKELEDRGIPGLLDQNESKNYKYGLSSWASFSNSNLVISPGETKKATVFIDKDRLSIGGHYAAVLAEIRQKDDEKSLKVRAILSSLLFVRTGSQLEVEEAKITDFNVLQYYFAFPKSTTFRINNTGNVDVTPYGVLKIYDPFGREVARSVVNEDSLITLPESIRKYTTPITSKKAILPPGIYKAALTLTFGKSSSELVASASFFSLGSLTVDRILIISIIGGGFSFLLLKFRRRDNTVK